MKKNFYLFAAIIVCFTNCFLYSQNSQGNNHILMDASSCKHTISLISPDNKHLETESSVHLIFGKYPGSEMYYQLNIATDTLFTNLIESLNNPYNYDSNNFDLTFYLKGCSKYYWRARFYDWWDTTNCSDWSEIRTFQTSSELFVPNIVSLVTETKFNDFNSIIFDWTGKNNYFDSYMFEISDSANMINSYQDTSSYTVSLEVNNFGSDNYYNFHFNYSSLPNVMIARFQNAGSLYWRIKVKECGNWGGFSGISSIKRSTSSFNNFTNDKNSLKLSLSPNPVSQSTEIRYRIADNCNIKLTLVGLLGQEIAVLKDGFEEAGEHNYKLQITNYELNSGMYFLRLVAGGKVETEKILIIR